MLKNLDIKIYNEINDELESFWRSLEKKSSKFYFQTFKWQKYWYHQIRKYKKKTISTYVIVVKNEKEALLILPFCIRKSLIFKILSWSGYPFSDYNIPLINKNFDLSKDDFEFIWKKIIQKNDKDYNCILLENQPENINEKVNPFFKFFKTKETNFFSGIFLKDYVIDQNEQISDINYQKNRLNKIGDLKFNIAKNKKEKKKILEFIIKNKSLQYKKTNAKNIFSINAYKKFFIQCNLKLDINLSFLTLNNDIIAAHSGYIHDQNFYYLFPAYDMEYKRYSPGKILLHFLVKKCVDERINYFDFTSGTERYKKKWSNNEVRSFTTLKSLNIVGFFYILLIESKILFKSLILKNNYLIKIYKKIKSSDF